MITWQSVNICSILITEQAVYKSYVHIQAVVFMSVDLGVCTRIRNNNLGVISMATGTLH